MSFDDDFKRGDKILNIKGNQIPDTPEWMIKSGFVYTVNNFEISPKVKWVDSRYGDALNKEKVDDYVVVKLNLGYTLRNFWKLSETKVTLELNNLFDNRYVGAIEANDSGTGADYFAGPPFTAILTMSGKF
jgi:iron complex outermembrane receptor protein